MRRVFVYPIVFGLAAAQPVAAQDSGAEVEGATVRDAVEELLPAVDTSPARATSAESAPARSAREETSSAASAAAARPAAIDRLDLGTTSITGNQELPKVLYIVPWKRSDLGDLIGRPVNTLLDEVLAPVDRSVFERHLSYYETLHGESQEE